MTKKYTPFLIDTSDIVLTKELEELTEKMAQNVHDVWAIGRFNDGWTYGPSRDDNAKTNPCLVNYEDLPEIEKAYDRDIAIQILKLILKLGWNLEKRK